jgi:hypothetical protein
MPGYDDRKTGRGNAFAVGREDGAYYARSWQAAIDSSPDWIIITSFNEWPEGTYIEPSQAYGTRYLEMTSQWAATFRGSPIPPPVPSAPQPAPAATSSILAVKPTQQPPSPTPTPPPTPTAAPTPITPEPIYRVPGAPARL